MPDRSTPRGILTSSNLFSAIETEVASAAESTVIIEPDACAPGVPAMAVTAAQAREIVRGIEPRDSLRDAIWATLVRRTITWPRSWQQLAIWTALPGLRVIVNRLYRVWRTDLDDLRSEVVLGFLEALRRADPEQSHLGARLWWNTYRLALQMCQQGVRERAVENIELAAGLRAGVGDTEPLPASGQHDPQAVESARLGALAARLGLRAVINTRPSDDGCRVVFLPKGPSNVANFRGNGSGEAA
ncbi:hypothetical protein EV192_105346 [Actinocrispum wychmicini]|uniref:Uncharacterized protein n=1 Tax=Actinocrispum wychmicini TaxID=1213861 RepID=A0A4R2JEZ2_9PSEU|nr:hypothetical protein EV192_105346 [Actinocrispum wychmicini]